MLEYEKRAYPEGIRTANELIHALRRDPPVIFQDVSEVIDRTAYGNADPFFTIESMRLRFEELIPFTTIYPFNGRSEFHFGRQYEAISRELTKEGLIRAKRITYFSNEVEGTLVPAQTIGLYDRASLEKGLKTIGIELTRYKKIGSHEVVHVYTLMEETGASLANTKIIVGIPNWNMKDRRTLAKSFGVKKA